MLRPGFHTFAELRSGHLEHLLVGDGRVGQHRREYRDRRKVVVSPVNERIDALLGPYYVDQARLLARAIQTCKPAEKQAVAGFLRRLNEMRDAELG